MDSLTMTRKAEHLLTSSRPVGKDGNPDQGRAEQAL